MGVLRMTPALFLGWLVSINAQNPPPVSTNSTRGFGFVRDTSFDGRQVTNDPGRVRLVTTSLTGCSVTCVTHSWCSSFFYTNATGACSLHATAFAGPSLAEVSAGTQYFRQTEDWCPTTPMVVFNRPARMCVYLEVNTSRMASGWAAADSACRERGMRLIHNLDTFRMRAVLNFTIRNKAIINRSTFIGLKRGNNGAFQWINGQALDTQAMKPFWESGQPNGQNCVVIRASVDSTLNDVDCGPHIFICEKARPVNV